MNTFSSFPANERGTSDLGWLRSSFSFSFANYYNPEKMGFGMLRVINDDWVAPGKGFGKHPHSNMEIITIPFSGSLSHQDSLGNAAIIQAGEVQSMSAGTGILHSEMNMDPYIPVELFQIWIQTRNNNIDPQYSQKMFEESKRINTWQLLAGPDAKGENVLIHQDAFLSRVSLTAQSTILYTKHLPENGIYLMNISGDFKIGEHILGNRDALGIEGNEAIEIYASEQSDILVIEVPMN